MLISQRPTLSEEILTDSRSQFVIEPLEPGFGYTLGNSLRRTLLSSIPGAAVTSIRIEGVLHEFSTVPGVKDLLSATQIVGGALILAAMLLMELGARFLPADRAAGDKAIG